MKRRKYFADATDYNGRVLLQIGEHTPGAGSQSISIFLTAAASYRLRRDLRAAEGRARASRKAAK